ncbi:hypothetical protein DFH07DRAFT_960780 [Mycena maculata]|uniref:Uncharacterized protein n=1 Tax=Mycena maculata TaxID=230809 RepID=A0AAD7N917_9AGAR|nr:hypothetical protein DFH07DRAFT_960780 [Mycena maculata]
MGDPGFPDVDEAEVAIYIALRERQVYAHQDGIVALWKPDRTKPGIFGAVDHALPEGVLNGISLGRIFKKRGTYKEEHSRLHDLTPLSRVPEVIRRYEDNSDQEEEPGND